MDRMKGITYSMGFVYCHLEKRTNRYKIGYTYKYPEERLKELNSTGMSDNLIFQFAIYVKDYIKTENLIHKILENQGFRYRKDREFFTVSLSKILELFNTFNIDGYDIIYPNNSFHQNQKRNYDEIDIEMIDSENFNYKLKCKKKKKLNDLFGDRQKIRHIIKMDEYNDIWVGTYDLNIDSIIYDGIKYPSITKFATAHYRRTPCKKNNCHSGLNECEYIKNDKIWYSTKTL